MASLLRRLFREVCYERRTKFLRANSRGYFCVFIRSFVGIVLDYWRFVYWDIKLGMLGIFGEQVFFASPFYFSLFLGGSPKVKKIRVWKLLYVPLVNVTLCGPGDSLIFRDASF